jgi:hypothetical protein
MVKVAKKATGRKKTKRKVAKKKTTRRKAAKKVHKKAKRRGRPPGSGKKRGRKPGVKAKRGSKNSIDLPVTSGADLVFWSEMVIFLNANQGKTFIVQMDGSDYTLNAT